MTNSFMALQTRMILAGLLLTACHTLNRPSHGKIVGGSDLATEQVLQSVTVAILDESAKPFCSGTLLSPQWIVTAAHCLHGREAAKLSVARWSGGTLVQASKVEHVALYEAELKGLEFPNFDVALVRFAGFPAFTPPPMPIAAAELSVQGLGVYLAGFGAEQTDCESDACLGRGRLVKSTVAERLHGGRMRSLLRMKGEPGSGACHGDSGGPAFVRQGAAYQLLGATVGVWLDLMPELAGLGPSLCESGQVLYTDLRDYRPWIESVMSGGERAPARPKSRPRAADFAAWCRYENPADEAWKTLQRLLQAVASEEGVDSKRLFLDCDYAHAVLKERTQTEISFVRPSGGAKLYPLRSIVPLEGLGPMRLLTIYFNSVEALEVSDNLVIDRLEIASSTLDTKSVCHIAAKIKVQELSLWEISGELLDLGCLSQSTSLKKLELGGVKLKDAAVLDALRRKMAVHLESD